MKLSSKIIMLAAGTAVLSSAVTAVAMKQALFSSDEAKDFNELFTDANSGTNGSFTRVSQLPANPSDFTTAAESTINGVVSIKSYATPRYHQQGNNGIFGDPFFEYFFGNPGSRRSQPRQQEQPKQQPVDDGAERLEVTLNDNRTFDATVVGTDATTDLALIKIDAKDLPVIPMGDSEALKVGEWVLAVGNPFGFTTTVTPRT